ncbi:putative serine protease HtrA [Posidoniimonas polymericola]|uniref:Putative serine protease HtrA n=1 Tax=Posidoniimonas polymericola TaxID=2528002 RepID=A0A5C5YLU3_9BACT|nr:trypsin-like peptidase domain-containing protein [Posidoniimonas polymericola]TWT75825.1 putative serine protease HtrA [Posidoniimonas polymericola]
MQRILIVITVLAASARLAPAAGPELDPRIEQAEQQRVQTVRRITPATIAVFDNQGEGGGSGVIIRADGLAVTNFHVVAPCGPFMTCGLPDGRVVAAVLLGVDPPGDVALIRLIDDRPFPVAEIGDSDRVSAGEEVFVVGNPFLLADDLQPTVTCGILSGVHRYQYPAGSILEYADCLQTDAAINPGNSGGPLYDSRGRLIGINGRASFEKRGRVNVGVGYAISINQVLRFAAHLESGRIVDHARLGATVSTLSRGRVVIDDIDADSDAYRRGLRYGDQVVRLAGRDVTSANQVQNIVATYPPGSRLAITCLRAGGETIETTVRLSPAHEASELEEIVGAQLAQPPKEPPIGDVFEPRVGYANYLPNRAHRDLILQTCLLRVEAGASLPWRITGTDANRGKVALDLAADRVTFSSERSEYWIDPNADLSTQRDPPGSGGLLAALSLMRTLFTEGPAGLQDCYYVGALPRGSSDELRDCIVAHHHGATAEFYFTTEACRLERIEYFSDAAADPCVVLLNWPDASAQRPAGLRVSVGDDVWLNLDELRLTASAEASP